jgi:cyclophilin family peptidyl-prolyl cis-trans isomerase
MTRQFDRSVGDGGAAAIGNPISLASPARRNPLMRLPLLAFTLASLLALPALAEEAKYTPTPKELLAQSSAQEWRTPDPANLLDMKLPDGHVLIELAPQFTPLHAANIRTLVREHYFDGLAIVRVQDNFVTQWDDPAADDEDTAHIKPLGSAKATLPPEYTRAIDPQLEWTPLPDGDVYAPQVGFSEGFPAARDPAAGRMWLTHCYGMVGVARDIGPETGNGSALYAIIGQAPRGLDRNLAIAGRVIEGMELLSGLPRGPAPMGFYTDKRQRVPIESVRLAADLPPAQRPKIEVLRTDSATFARLVEAKRNRRDAFYAVPAGKIDLCSVAIPSREKK